MSNKLRTTIQRLLVVTILGGFSILQAKVTTDDFAEAQPRAKGYSEQQVKEMANYNQAVTEQGLFGPAFNMLGARSSENIVPYAEYENAGYLFFSDDDYAGEAKHIKEMLADNLPADVTLVVFTRRNSVQHPNYIQQLKAKYLKYVRSDRLKILPVTTRGNYFWARDGLPIPVWDKSEPQPQLAMVDAKYYHRFESDAQISARFNAELFTLNYYFEGGNFIVNTKGDCLVVNRVRPPSMTGQIPDVAFKDAYGCKRLIRLPLLKGIGHADEVVKFMSDTVVLTDTHQYVELLESAGFEVVMLPEPDLKYETYVNSLQVNDVIYVPTFGESGDQAALDTYAKFGLKVVPIPTRGLAINGQGGIHCITMTYPNVPYLDVVRGFGIN